MCCLSPGGCEDQCKDTKGIFSQILKDGQGKSCCLAAAGVRCPEHILARKNGRYAPLLNLCWLHNAQRPANPADTETTRHLNLEGDMHAGIAQLSANQWAVPRVH